MILYKYYPCDRYTLASLAASGIWCHYPNMMNDPFECLNVMRHEFSENILNDFKTYCDTAKSRTLKQLSTLDNAKLPDFINELRKGYINKYALAR